MEFQAEMKYVLDTIWLLISGALVMWMAAGFAMLEAGMVRTKNVTAILTKNIALYSVACIAFYLIGYNLMYGEGNAVLGSGFALSGTSADGHSLLSDFFFIKKILGRNSFGEKYNIFNISTYRFYIILNLSQISICLPFKRLK